MRELSFNDALESGRFTCEERFRHDARIFVQAILKYFFGFKAFIDNEVLSFSTSTSPALIILKLRGALGFTTTVLTKSTILLCLKFSIGDFKTVTSAGVSHFE